MTSGCVDDETKQLMEERDQFIQQAIRDHERHNVSKPYGKDVEVDISNDGYGGGPYDFGDYVTTTEWFNETMGYEFSGRVIKISLIYSTIGVWSSECRPGCEFDNADIISWSRFIKEDMWITSNMTDDERYEWVHTVNGVYGLDMNNTKDCKFYIVERDWVKQTNFLKLY